VTYPEILLGGGSTEDRETGDLGAVAPWSGVLEAYSMQVESGLQSALHLHTVWLFTEGDDTRGCGDKICPPEDEQRAALNVLRIVV